MIKDVNTDWSSYKLTLKLTDLLIHIY